MIIEFETTLSGVWEFGERRKDGTLDTSKPVTYFRLNRPLICRVGEWTVCIPVGFVTDGKSFLNHFDRYLLAAVLHDWFYYTGVVPKDVADSIFYTACRELGGWFSAHIYWLGVRLFAWSAWEDHRKNDDHSKRWSELMAESRREYAEWGGISTWNRRET